MGSLRLLTNYRLCSYVLRDGDAWVAHCLALGLVVQGDTIGEALTLLADCAEETVSTLLDRGVNPLTAFNPSPETVKEFEFVRVTAHRKCVPGHVPPEALSGICEMLMPMPRQSEHSQWATPADPFDGLTVTLAVAC
jgi:hypothetical protein